VSSIRVVLTVTPANPELFADLGKVPARLRAERVRTLATLGLAAMSGGIAITKPPVPDSPATDQQGKERPARALHFAKSLGDGV
jgi:hypothetical protein